MRRQTRIDIGESRVMYRQFDRLPGLLLRIVDDFDRPIDLTGTTVGLTVRRISGIAGLNSTWSPPRQAVIRDAINGLIFYDMQPEDTNTDPGEFELSAIIYEFGNRIATAPTRPDMYLQINTLVDMIEMAEFYLTTKDDLQFVLDADAQVYLTVLTEITTVVQPALSHSTFLV